MSLARLLPLLSLPIAMVAMLATTAAPPQAFPHRAVRVFVGFAPGGAADTIARALDDGFARELGQPIVIENRSGAGSAIASEYVAKAAPDGHTLLLASAAGLSVHGMVNARGDYRPAEFVPVTRLTSSPLVVAVSTGTGITSVADLVAEARKRPGKLNYASSGIGSAPHLAAALFARENGLDMVHVPFRGGAPAAASVASGDSDIIFGSPSSVLPMVQAGRLRALAVTSAEPWPLMPDLPGMRAAGFAEYDVTFWYGLFAPADTPEDVVRTVFNAATAAAKAPAFQAAMARDATRVAVSRSPREFAAFLAEDGKAWSRFAKQAGAQVE